MGTGEEEIREELDLIRKTHDAMPSSVITVDENGRIIYLGGLAPTMVPMLRLGEDLREALEEITHVEKVDRILIRRELTTFAATPDGPELHWIIWDRPHLEGLRVLTVWETDWSEQMNERRAAFMMAASHELRGPLTTLQGFAEILNMDTSNMTPEQAEAAEIVERTARHLTVLVEDVFDLSRNSFGELTLSLCQIDLAAVVEAAVSHTRPEIESRGQEIHADVGADLPIVTADQARATQMISNLIKNASIHNCEGISITVSAKVEGENIAIRVADDGAGLPFENPNDAFRTFHRGEGATAGDRSGSGIGLSITKRLIQLHRGDITVESTRGEGATFTLLFPIDRATALTPGEPGPA